MHLNARAVSLVVVAAAMSSCASNGSPGSEPPPAGSATQSAIAHQTPDTTDGGIRWSVSEPHGIGYGMGAIWLVGHHSTEVYRIDPATNEMTGFRGAPNQAQDVLPAFDSLWIPGSDGPMARMDPLDGTVLASLSTYADAEAGFGAVWAVSTSNDLDRIAPESNEVTLSIEIGSGVNDYNNTVAIGPEYVWVAVPDAKQLKAFDPVTGDEIASLQVDAPGWVAAGDAGIWMSLENGALLHIDEEPARISATVQTGSAGYNLVEVGDDAIWFAGADLRLRRFDLRGVEVGSLALAWKPEGLVIGAGSAWVEYYRSPSGRTGWVERIELSSVID
jgi:hypothetical protein